MEGEAYDLCIPVEYIVGRIVIATWPYKNTFIVILACGHWKYLPTCPATDEFRICEFCTKINKKQETKG